MAKESSTIDLMAKADALLAEGGVSPEMAAAETLLMRDESARRQAAEVDQWVLEVADLDPRDLMAEEEKVRARGGDEWLYSTGRDRQIKVDPKEITGMDFARRLVRERPGDAMRLARKGDLSRSDLDWYTGRKKTNAAERKVLSDNLIAAMYEQRFARSPEDVLRSQAVIPAAKDGQFGYKPGLAMVRDHFDRTRIVDKFRERAAASDAKRRRARQDPKRREELVNRLSESVINLKGFSLAEFDDPEAMKTWNREREAAGQEQLPAGDEGRLMYINADRAKAGLPPIQGLPDKPGFFATLQEEFLTAEGLKRRAPILSGVFTVGELLRIKETADRMEKGEESLEDLEIMAHFQERMARDARGKTFMGEVAMLSSESLTMGFEFAAGSAAVSVAKAGAKAGVKKAAQAVGKKIAAETVAARVGSLTSKVAAAAAKEIGGPKILSKAVSATAKGGAGLASKFPGFYAGSLTRTGALAADRMVGSRVFTEGEDNEIKAHVLRHGEEFDAAMNAALLDTGIEVGTELSGGIFTELMPARARKFLHEKMIRGWISDNNSVWNGFTSVLNKVGYNGTFPEMGEEMLGTVLRWQLGVQPPGADPDKKFTAEELVEQWPSWRDLGVQAIAFSLPGMTKWSAAAVFERAKIAKTRQEWEALQLDFAAALKANKPDLTDEEAARFAAVAQPFVRQWAEEADVLTAWETARYVPENLGYDDRHQPRGWAVRDKAKNELVKFIEGDPADQPSGEGFQYIYAEATEKAHRLNLEIANRKLFDKLNAWSTVANPNFKKPDGETGKGPVTPEEPKGPDGTPEEPTGDGGGTPADPTGPGGTPEDPTDTDTTPEEPTEPKEPEKPPVPRRRVRAKYTRKLEYDELTPEQQEEALLSDDDIFGEFEGEFWDDELPEGAYDIVELPPDPASIARREIAGRLRAGKTIEPEADAEAVGGAVEDVVAELAPEEGPEERLSTLEAVEARVDAGRFTGDQPEIRPSVSEVVAQLAGADRGASVKADGPQTRYVRSLTQAAGGSVAGEGETADVVVLAPPRTAVKGVTPDADPGFGVNEIRAAVAELPEGGRLIAVTSPGVAEYLDREGDTEKPYTVHGVQTFGDTGIVVIDKAAGVAPLEAAEHADLQSLWRHLGPLREVDVHDRVRVANPGKTEKPGGTAGTGKKDPKTGGGNKGGSGTGRGKRGKSPGKGGRGGSGGTDDAGKSDGAGKGDETAGADSGEGGADAGAEGEGGDAPTGEEPAGPDDRGGVPDGGGSSTTVGGANADETLDQLGGLFMRKPWPKKRGRGPARFFGMAVPSEPPAPADPNVEKQRNELVAKLIVQASQEGRDTLPTLLEWMSTRLPLEKLYRMGVYIDAQWGRISTKFPKKFPPADNSAAYLTAALDLEAKRSAFSRLPKIPTWSQYTPTILPANGQKAQPHPAKLVETSSLASVPYPKTDYVPELPEDWLRDGVISDAQYESVVLAGLAHSRRDHDSQRMGIILADGTGTGKTRQILSIIEDNWNRGRRKAVFITVNPELIESFAAESAAMGASAKIIPWGKKKAKDDLSKVEGVLAGSYGLFAYGEKDASGNTHYNRFLQLRDFLGRDFDGVIVLDEAHLLKAGVKFDANKAVKQNQDDASVRGQLAIQLQEQFPSARLVYATATPAVNAEDLSAFSRLGMWGQDEEFPFQNVGDFVGTISGFGRAGMEQFARDMKANGLLLSRQISYEGVTIDNVLIEDDEHLKKVDNLSEAWKEMRDFFTNAAVAINNAAKDAGARRPSAKPTWKKAVFYGAQLRVMNQAQAALKVQHLLPQIAKELEEGYGDSKEPVSVIISMTSTGEADTDRKGDTDIVSSREAVIGMVEEYFPTTFTYNNVEHHVETAQELKDQLLQMLESGSLSQVFPENALDMIVNHFGHDKVAEISGRSQRFDPESNALVDIEKGKGLSTKSFMRNEFQSGNRRIAVITAAGSVGIDLHAGNKVGNKQRRHMYIVQPHWSAQGQAQAIGRGHRSNQASAPIVSLVTLDTAADRRLQTSASSRLRSMGAASSGERKSQMGAFEEEDLLGAEGRDVMWDMLSKIVCCGSFEDVLTLDDLEGLDMIEEVRGTKRIAKTFRDVSKVLNRLQALPRSKSNRFFEVFASRTAYRIQSLRDANLGDLEMRDFKAYEQREAADPIVLYRDEVTGAETTLRFISAVTPSPNTTSWTSLQKDLAQQKEWAKAGWYREMVPLRFFKNRRTKKLVAVLGIVPLNQETKKPEAGAKTEYLEWTPGREAWRAHDKPERYSVGQYAPVPEAEARKLWIEQQEKIPPFRRGVHFVVTGSMFPKFDVIFGRTANRMGRIFPVRVRPESGEPPISGVLIYAGAVAGLVERTGTGDKVGKVMDAAFVIDQVLSNGVPVYLRNGLALSRYFTEETGMAMVVDTGRAVGFDKNELKALGWLIGEKSHYMLDQDHASLYDVVEATIKKYPVFGMVPPTRKEQAEAGGKAGGPGGPTGPSDPAAPAAMSAQPKPAAAKVPTVVEAFGTHLNLLEDPDNVVEPLGWHELVAGLERIWRVSVEKSRLGVRGAAGLWIPNSFGSHVRIARKYLRVLGVLAHEIGHQVDLAIYRHSASFPDMLVDELRSLDYDQRERRTWEGWAELFRLLMTNPEEAVARAPNLTAWFMRTLGNPDLKWAKSMRARFIASKNLFDRYRLQSAEQRAVANMKTTDLSKVNPGGESFAERLRRIASSFWDRFVLDVQNSGVFFKRMMKDARRQGINVLASLDPQKVYDTVLLRAPVFAEDAIKGKGVILLSDYSTIGEPLSAITGNLMPEDMDRWKSYVIALQTLEIYGYDRNAQESMTMEEALAIKESVDVGASEEQRNRIQDATRRLTQYNNSLLWVLVDAGALDAKTAEILIRKWKFYAPLLRAQYGTVGSGPGRLRVFNVPSPIKPRHGSRLPAIDPLDSTIKRTIDIYAAAARARVVGSMLAVARASARQVGMPPLPDDEGFGFMPDEERQSGEAIQKRTDEFKPNTPVELRGTKLWITELPVSMKKDEFTLGAIADAIKKETGINLRKIAKASGVPLETIIGVWRPDISPHPSEHVVTAYVGGQKRMFQIDEGLHMSMAAVGHNALPQFLDITVGAFVRLLKAGATGLSLTFAFKNAPNDYIAYLMQREQPKEAEGVVIRLRGVRVVLRPAEALMAVARSAASPLFGTEADPFYELYKALGVQWSSLLHGDKRQSIKRAAKAISPKTPAGRALRMLNPRTLVDGLRDIVSVSEVPARLAAFQEVLEANGYTRAKLRSGAQIPANVMTEALWQAAEITTNFARGGRYRAWIDLVPYGNAAIQGFERMTRTWVNDPAKAFLRSSVFAAITAAWWMKVNDDDWYQEAPEWLKYGTFGVTGEDGRIAVRLPRGHSWSVVSSATQIMLDTLKERNPEAVRKWARYVLKSSMVGTELAEGRMPIGFYSTMSDLRANIDWKGDPIETESLRRSRLPEDRYRPHTLQTSRALGKYVARLAEALGTHAEVSPLQIEYFLNQMSGGVYRSFLAAGESLVAQAARGEAFNLSPADTPIMRGYVLRFDPAASVGELYEARSRHTQSEGSAKVRGEALSAAENNKGAIYDRTIGMIEAIRDAAGHTNDRDMRWMTQDRYAIALSRAALGKPPLEHAKLPWRDPEFPATLRSVLDSELAKVAKLAAKLPPEPESKARQIINGRSETNAQRDERLAGYEVKQADYQASRAEVMALARAWDLKPEDLIDAMVEAEDDRARPMKPETIAAYAQRIERMFKGDAPSGR